MSEKEEFDLEEFKGYARLLGAAVKDAAHLEIQAMDILKRLETLEHKVRDLDIEEHISNLLASKEKENLINKLKEGTIRKDEAEKLKGVLEEEQRDAEKRGDVVAVIVIGLLLASLSYTLYKLTSKEE